MPYAGDRAARLFYDETCGPCRLLARASEGLSRQKLVATPLSGASADDRLADLDPESRYAFAHLDSGSQLRTGEAITAPLVGLTLGPTWERVVRGVPPVDRSLRRLYLWLWDYRRTRGCAARRLG